MFGFSTEMPEAFVGDAARLVLLLTGPLPQDEVEARSHLKSLQRFGMKIADARRFVAGNDPRRRELNNIRLPTQGTDYDVVLAVDTGSQIARTFPYRSVLPRPVVGDAGRVVSAWHWTFERYGAPRLNQRFSREVDSQRPMADPESAARVAVRAIVEAHAQAKSSDPAMVAAVIRSPRSKAFATPGTISTRWALTRRKRCAGHD